MPFLFRGNETDGAHSPAHIEKSALRGAEIPRAAEKKAAHGGATRPAWKEQDLAAPPRENPHGDFAETDPALHNDGEPEIFGLLRNSGKGELPKEVLDLAGEITEGKTNSLEKARAIYRWITDNIVYDRAEWEHITGGASSYSHDHDPVSVIRRKTTVCVGYAWLFNDLCKASGVVSQWIIGNVRGYRGTPDDELVTRFKHAWNAVMDDDGAWRLLDATWGAAGEEKSPERLRTTQGYYFDTPPWQFAFDHFPEDAAWQLLDSPIGKEAFLALPNLKPSFFLNGLKLAQDYPGALGVSPSAGGEISIAAPPSIEILPTISFRGAEETVLETAPQGGLVRRVAIPPVAKDGCILRIYSGKAGGELSCSADFLLAPIGE